MAEQAGALRGDLGLADVECCDQAVPLFARTTAATAGAAFRGIFILFRPGGMKGAQGQ